MSKALVINGADFSVNKVTTVTLVTDDKPCTGIELAESAITANSVGFITLEYTVTPADTTDSVVWSSSDTSVATVNGNVVTVVGIGQTTITATCGNYSDSLVLTADLYETADWYRATYYSMPSSSGNTTIGMKPADAETAFNRLVGGRDKNFSDFYEIADTNDYSSDSGVTTIQVPNNVGRIEVTSNGSDFDNTATGYAGISVIFADGNESVMYAGYEFVKGISTDYIAVSNNKINGSVELPEGANSFLLGIRLKTNAAAGTDPTTIAENNNIVIHYLPQAEE